MLSAFDDDEELFAGDQERRGCYLLKNSPRLVSLSS